MEHIPTPVELRGDHDHSDLQDHEHQDHAHKEEGHHSHSSIYRWLVPSLVAGCAPHLHVADSPLPSDNQTDSSIYCRADLSSPYKAMDWKHAIT